MLTVFHLVAACSEVTSKPPPADTATAPDTADTAERWGLLSTHGVATVLADFTGRETTVFKDEATDAELCRAVVDLVSVEHDDCGECAWAYVLEVQAASVTTDLACPAVGWDAPDALVGTRRSYAYAEDYLGHGPALLVHDDNAWQPVGFAWWDVATGELTYARSGGYVAW